jgi:pimeloyl-ACP methyl ester carboxylesterase
MRASLIALSALAVLSLAGCPPKPKPVVPQKAGYVRRANTDTVIVFVHGVFGGAVSTWTNESTSAYWPDLVKNDPAFGDADIYTLGYDTNFFSPGYSLDDLIENARLHFAADEIFKHKHVVFVCHSMGGLVVRGFIKRYQANAPQVQLIYFLSTPTAGAHIASLGTLFSRNSQLHAMMPARADDFVNTLQHDWRALPVHPLSKCAFEKQDTYGIRIVDEQSAAALCDGPLDPINENHINIVKPADQQATAYLAFRQAYLGRPTQPPAGQNPDERVMGHVDTLRMVQVNCGEVKEELTQIPPPFTPQTDQKIVDAVASLQSASNLKHGTAEGHGIKDQQASVYYRLEGLDMATGGTCGGQGSGVIAVAFIVNQPRAMALPTGFQAISDSDQALAMLRRPGTILIPTETLRFIPSIADKSPTSNKAWVLHQEFNENMGHVMVMAHPESLTAPMRPIERHRINQ